MQYMNKYSDIHPIASTLPAPLDEATAARVAELFRAFSDPSRVRIIAALAGSELNVSALAAMVGVSESAVSHHLRGLRQMRLVRARKDGRQVFYGLDDDHVAALFRQGLDHVQHG
jgi:ArsR family transcriptional regulator, lead/cadmium/zinc/bismuth-responsive transcriptional repressor